MYILHLKEEMRKAILTDLSCVQINKQFGVAVFHALEFIIRILLHENGQVVNAKGLVLLSRLKHLPVTQKNKRKTVKERQVQSDAMKS